jgi:hypothetical protein
MWLLGDCLMPVSSLHVSSFFLWEREKKKSTDVHLKASVILQLPFIPFIFVFKRIQHFVWILSIGTCFGILLETL